MLKKHKSLKKREQEYIKKYQPLEKDHLYKKCKFTPDWGGSTPLENWKIHEIINKCRVYDDAYTLCESASQSGELEEFDTIIREKLWEYYKPKYSVLLGIGVEEEEKQHGTGSP